MKRVRIGFLAIVGILAIGLTAATNADVMKKFNPNAVTTCTANVDWVKVNLKPIGAGAPQIHYNPAFAPAPGSTACPGDLGTFCAAGILRAPVTFQCTAQSNFFCCAKQITPVSPCGTISGGVDYTPYPLKVQVFCKTDAN